MAFQPGQSGNPGGRPKAFKDVEAAAREHTPSAIAALACIVTNAKAPPAARVRAAEVLLDRAWGKARQHMQASGTLTLGELVAASFHAAERG